MNENLKEIINREMYIDGELFLPKIIDKEKYLLSKKSM